VLLYCLFVTGCTHWLKCDWWSVQRQGRKRLSCRSAGHLSHELFLVLLPSLFPFPTARALLLSVCVDPLSAGPTCLPLYPCARTDRTGAECEPASVIGLASRVGPLSAGRVFQQVSLIVRTRSSDAVCSRLLAKARQQPTTPAAAHPAARGLLSYLQRLVIAHNRSPASRTFSMPHCISASRPLTRACSRLVARGNTQTWIPSASRPTRRGVSILTKSSRTVALPRHLPSFPQLVSAFVMTLHARIA